MVPGENVDRRHRRLSVALLVATTLLVLGSLSAARAGDDEAAVDLDQVGAGELLWCREGRFLPLPRGATEVDIAVTGILLHTTVAQTFHNPTAEVIEVIYVFPLPERAAVHHMEMRIGERRIVAEIREREQAKRVYERAKQTGRKAALLDQERPNLFTLAVANIGPGEIVSVHLEYNEELAFTDGEFLMRLPLTFTPRFIPYTRPESSPAGPRRGCVPEDVDDAERITPPFLPTHDERGMRARIQVRIQAGFPLETLKCPSHPVVIRQEGPCWDVRPATGSVRADRDFLLRWRPQPGRQPQASLFVEVCEGQQYGLLLLIPPIATSQAGRGLPTETLFVIDVSGSMKGPSIKQAREALLAALDRLRDGDRFNILRFSNDSDVYRHVFQSANDPQAMREAQRWVRDLEAGGGTRILPALQRAIAMTGAASDGQQQRIVLLTDAAIGNERAVFDAVHGGLGHARLHVVGIGLAPNSYFTRRLAQTGRGLCTFVADVDGAENEMDAFLERIHRPVMTGLEFSLNDRPLTEPYPDPLPDLYAGEPLVLSFRLPDGLARENLSASLQGHAATGEFHLTLSVTVNAERSAGVARRWARAKIAEHMDQLHEGADPERVRRDVIALATRFHLVTSFTSFVAVETTPTVSGTARTLRMPTTLPSGSHLMGLPRGGSRGPLTCLVGLVCICLAFAILLLVWRSAPRPVS